MNSSLVNSLAKVYDRNPLHGQKPVGKRLSPAGLDKPHTSSTTQPSPDGGLHCVESRMDSLSSQMDHLLGLQETVLTRLDGLSRYLGGVRLEVACLQSEGWGAAGSPGSGPSRDPVESGSVRAVCRELRGVVQEASERVEQQGRRLDGVERLMEGVEQVISFIGEVVKSSRVVELLFKRPGGRAKKPSRKAKDFKGKDGKDVKDKSKLNLKGLKTQKKRKPPDATDSASLSEPLLPDQVEKLNRQNAERSHGNAESEGGDGERGGGGGRDGGGGGVELLTLILDGQSTSVAQPEDLKLPPESWSLTEQRKELRFKEQENQEKQQEEKEDIFGESEPELEEGELKIKEAGEVGKTEEKRTDGEGEGSATAEQLSAALDIPSETSLPSLESSVDVGEPADSSKRHVTEEDLVNLKKCRVEEAEEAEEEQETEGVPRGAEPLAMQSHIEEEEREPTVEEYIIDSSPPPCAPFEHRIVTPKPHQIATFYSINREEVLGGGRFGQVHKCVENSSGLTLAAKTIKARSQKEKEVVKNEIQVMNQLNHANLIQLYAAFESRHDIILVMEYVDGGELFDRIIDENYNLTELDTVLFIRQISEGLQYMHKMYILHLDLKPENILCVSRATNKIKIIDFGLARRYKPREKLRVNFGTPEFLAPEVINYEFVSFPTDMWSLGVITYMLLSGLSPFLGDDDNETLNNILACQWNFEEEEFADISEEAKDFITRLLVKSKSWRMSAAESLRHPWLSDHSLHYRLHQKKNKCHSTHAPPPES